MAGEDERVRAMAEAYDEEAEATGWYGPEVAFGLAYKYVRPGQSILDLGIGTGLAATLFRSAGLKVYGMDVAQEMLDACRTRGFTELARHDLTASPYPYDAESLHHAVCVGVLNFVRDPSPVFQEVARILREGGIFVFAVGDRSEDESPEVVVGPERTGTGEPVTMYRHSGRQVEVWVAQNGFTLLRSLAFAVPMDREGTATQQIRAYLVRKAREPGPSRESRRLSCGA